MTNYREIAGTIVEEHRKVLLDVDEKEVNRLVDAIIRAKRIEVFGMGRMQCSVRAFVMRLMHMGLDAHVIYDTTCPNIGKGDLLILNSACTSVDYLILQLAKKAGARIVAITAHPESKTGRLADMTVRLPGQVLAGAQGEIPSIQPMAALFEQTILVFCDIVIMLLMERLNITARQMGKRHTNLDGYVEFDQIQVEFKGKNEKRKSGAARRSER